MKRLKEAAKTFAFRYTKLGAPNYPYNLEPIQLSLLINEIERLKDTPGNIIEIGVARGMSTRFLCEHIRLRDLEQSLTYYAVDTFESFIKSDLDFEVNERGKSRSELQGFAFNDFAIWKRNFSMYPFVQAVKADCVALDYTTLSPIKIALLDVDLYLPTRKTLPKLFDALIPGGVMLVDDVLENKTYDGAYHAYMEFCESANLTPTVIGNKCGVIRK
jgi:hypothetical protein